jgi:large subunit ribosomal protein L9
MKVILLQNVDKVGNKNDMAEVAPGFARNFLLPKSLAELATAKKIKEAKKRTEEEMQNKEKRHAELKLHAEEIKKLTLEFPVRADESGKVFGSVGKHDIENALHKKGYSSAHAKIEKAIKELGEHEITIDLGEGVGATLKALLRK